MRWEGKERARELANIFQILNFFLDCVIWLIFLRL